MIRISQIVGVSQTAKKQKEKDDAAQIPAPRFQNSTGKSRFVSPCMGPLAQQIGCILQLIKFKKSLMSI